MRFRYSRGDDGKTEKKAVVYTKDEHNIDARDLDKDATYICSRLRSEGYETYIVGGAVRDLILGKKPKDFDIVSAASPNRIKKIFRNARVIGRRFRLVHAYFGDKIYEVATFRSLKDGATGNTFGTVEEDVMRRDFSLNALFYDPEQELVIDYVGGFEDIQRRVINPVIPLNVIFSDDPVRMIRAVKYAAMTGFEIPPKLRNKIVSEAYLLTLIPASRLTEEALKIINSACPDTVVALLENYGLYRYLQPNASAMMETDEGFKERYMRSLAVLPEKSAEKNRPLRALIEDYIETIMDWNGDGQELFMQAFFAARKFIMPVSPQRLELGKAIRQIFAEHGIMIKRIHPPRRWGRDSNSCKEDSETASSDATLSSS
ncbi:MAG: polynucleotide adenylyltransferase PcnB [Spirochaetaceae bacterium]|nr:polynucleotide adenylyltransferase PcnB [Spirochaetaceae bacterium]